MELDCDFSINEGYNPNGMCFAVTGNSNKGCITLALRGNLIDFKENVQKVIDVLNKHNLSTELLPYEKNGIIVKTIIDYKKNESIE